MPNLRRVCLTLSVAAVVLAYAAGCTQHARVICEPLALVHAGDAAGAVVALDETPLADSKSDRFLYHTQRGHLLHMAGDYEGSNRALERAVRVAGELEPASVTATITDYAVNEAVKEYKGEDFERAYIHYYMALNYLLMDDFEGALVECRRVDQVFRDLDARYEGGARYEDDGFIRYLSGLVYESEGEIDEAFIDYKLAVAAFASEPDTLQGSLPPGLVTSLVCAARALGREDELTSVAGAELHRCDAGRGEIIVVIENGWAPYRREASVRVPIHRELVPEEFRGRTDLAALVKIAYPEFVSVASRGRWFGACATSADTANVLRRAAAEKVQDIDALARRSLERRIGAIKLRSTMRATAKQVALMRAKHESVSESDEDEDADDESRRPRSRREDGSGFWGWLFGWLIEDIATAAVSEIEQADTRSWVLLPADIWVARIPVEPGAYDIVVEDERGEVRADIGRVRVEPGRKAFRSCRVLEAPHPIRCKGASRTSPRRRLR